MKSKIYSSLAILMFAAATTTSCSDSFLDTTPVMSETESSFYKTDEQMFKALTACYDVLAHVGGPAAEALASMVPVGEIRSDNARTGGGSEQDQPYMQAIEAFSNTSVNSISDNLWKTRYRGIYRCNLVINADYDSPQAKIYKAEAKFLRAWYHFELLRYYGPCFISLETSYPEGFKFTRDTRENVNKAIEKDLLEAIPDLEDKFPATMKGRITKTAAETLLAKVYLYWADWNNDDPKIFDKAKPLLEDVINSYLYTLSFDYVQLFAAHQENNEESIFEIQTSTKSGNTNWGNVDGSEGAMWVTHCGPRQLKNNPDYDMGYGCLLPTQELYDYFLPDDQARRDAAIFTYDDLVTEPNLHIQDASKKVIWETSSYGPDFQGYAQKKYPTFKGYEPIGNPNLNRPGNVRVLRYGEVYLMLAEAYLRGTNPDDTKAKNYINELRRHHVHAADGSYLSVDDLLQTYPDRFKNVMDVLWYERRCELAGEGDRWFDLVRSGRAEEVMMPILRKDYGISAWKKEFNYLPIGSIEISNSGNSLTEYPDEAYE